MTDLMIEEDTTISRDLDKWIAKLYDCKPLAEAEVKQLCEQVSNHHINFILSFIIVMFKLDIY